MATIPLSWNDPLFSGLTNSSATAVQNGGSLSNFSTTDSGSIASVLLEGSATLNDIRINSEEAIRIGGSGNVTINNSYLQTAGVGSDHADTIQTFVGGGGHGNVTITNSTIAASLSSQNSGMFVADGYYGNFTFNNVVFEGGPVGLKINADAGAGHDDSVALSNVYFVGPFQFDPFLFTKVNANIHITQWDNVRYATIVNGQLVPGALIPPPQPVEGGSTTTPPPTEPTQPTLDAPAITSGNHTTNDNTVTVTGTAAAGSTVTVFDGTTKLGTTTVGSNGSWSYTTAALNDGKHSLTATDTVSGKTSAASSAATITVDTHAPGAPVLVSDSVVNTNHVLLSGTAEANSKVTVYDGTTAVGTATAGSNGAWTLTTGALNTGSHVLTATATDAAGNTSGHSQALDPVIGGGSTTPPTTTPSGLTGIVQVGNHYFLGDTGPELKYHGAVVATGQFQDWIPISSVQVDGGGYDVAWKNSSGQFTFWATDSHGNFTSYPTNGVALAGNSTTVESYETIFHQDLNGDHTIGVPGSPSSPSNPGSAAAISITNLTDSSQGHVTIKGTADAFSQIKLFDGTTAVGTVKAAADGTWSYTSSSAVSNKVHTFTAQELDGNGHVAATSGSAILGSSGANTLTSTGGNNLFVGNGHPDTFVFASNFGKDVIKDFNANASSPGHDVIQFSKNVFDSFADVLSHATQSGQNVVIAHGADTLTLNNVKLSSLDKHDFHFA